MKFNGYSKQILGLFLALGALSCLALYNAVSFKNEPKLAIFDPKAEANPKQIVQEIAALGSDVAQTLQKQLIEEQNANRKALQDAFPLPNNQWEDLALEFADFKAKDDLFTSKPAKNKPEEGKHKLVAKIEELLISYGMNPDRVVINCSQEPTSFICTNQSVSGDLKIRHYFEVNLSKLEKFPADIQETLIRHELMHLFNYDSLDLALIQALFTKNNILPEDYCNHPAYAAFNRHQEYRADLMAAGNDIARAQTFMKDFQRYMDAFPDDQENPTHVTHPTEKQRHAAMSQLASYLTIEKEIASA